MSESKTNRPKEKGIPIEELNRETLQKLGFIKEERNKDEPLDAKFISLGKVWKALENLTKGDARWVCREVLAHLTGRIETRGGDRAHKEKINDPRGRK